MITAVIGLKKSPQTCYFTKENKALKGHWWVVQGLNL
jgi:hypothetical protein